MIKVRKIVTYCMIGTIAFASRTVISNAAEVPIAGIDVLLSDFYQNTDKDYKDIKNYLSSDFFKEYADISFAQVTDYVNIRKKPSEESKIIGKLYNNSAATIISKKGEWYKVKSGTVTGYIKSDYLVTGKEAAEVAGSVGSKVATVNTTTLKVRKETSTDAPIITLLPIGEELKVKKEMDGWIKVSLGSQGTGYVSADYVDLSTEFTEAVSIEEEKAKLAAEEAARKAAEQSQSTDSSANNNSSNNSSSNTARYSAKSNNISSQDKISSNSSSNSSSSRDKIVSYALKFQGNPYVYGGTSLTNGTDCSGFTQSVFSNNGIYIPRDSRSQASSGKSVSISDIRPGDLIFYSRNGSINHVALYIGNGQVISASSPKTGIVVRSYNYRQPVKAVSYIN
ncbi:C40 family peptidase [Anaerocolumna sp. MB42-C2]|uniref:C40 family peptidase n=1 Tax=Anaerocolumna sp. MB42-C2 TaxID=3070997 RepID=UPI0027DFF648|nr:C40 family peptidase [Anaerocolumna sp. MB42-C2]WMJ88634.1 NlpC/P60 family protein [Anaerocolumna sp. MB42-C2]